MPTPTLSRGSNIFLPQHGLRTIISITDEMVGGTKISLCCLQHYFSNKTERWATIGLFAGKVRAPTSKEIAFNTLLQLQKPPTRKLTGRWKKQEADIKVLICLGTLEKNLLALRLLYDINQGLWKSSRVELYGKVLRCVIEEIA